MKYYLIKFEQNYADEFDVYGFMLLTTPELEELLGTVENKDVDYQFGTNEYVTFNPKTLLDSRVEISKDKYDAYMELCTYCNIYGNFPWLSDEDY